MYYLEDKHPDYEFTFYVQVKNATPYINVWHAHNMYEVYEYIREIEERHNRTKQPFFIDNDFYDNKYKDGHYNYYYRFLQRKVNDWEQISLRKNVIKLVK